jgi:renal tumor antigen
MLHCAHLNTCPPPTTKQTEYRLVAKRGEGTFSEVLKAQCVRTGRYVAVKCMKNRFESLEAVNALREVQALRRLSPHPHIVRLLEVLFDAPTGRLALVFELMVRGLWLRVLGAVVAVVLYIVFGTLFGTLSSSYLMHKTKPRPRHVTTKLKGHERVRAHPRPAALRRRRARAPVHVAAAARDGPHAPVRGWGRLRGLVGSPAQRGKMPYM